jgi:TPR repeat protein
MLSNNDDASAWQLQDVEQEPDLVRLNEAYGLLEANPGRAIAELQSLAESGSVLSMIYLGWIYQTDNNIDMKKAESWLRRACDKGSKLAIYYLGHLYLKQREYEKAREIFMYGDSNDYAPATYCLAEMYIDGSGAKKQLEKARELLEKATSLGHVFAKRSLARLLMSGRFGFFNMFRGFFLLLGALKDGFVVGIKEPSSDRLRA